MARDPNELTPAQVAAEFKVSPSTVRRWEKANMLHPTRRLPGSGYRRYSRADIEAFKAKLAETGWNLEGQPGPVSHTSHGLPGDTCDERSPTTDPTSP